MVLKLKIIKQELQFEECLKQRLEFICEFAKVTPTFINGSIRKLEKTNLTYIEPHRVIIKNITFLVVNVNSFCSFLAKNYVGFWQRIYVGGFSPFLHIIFLNILDRLSTNACFKDIVNIYHYYPSFLKFYLLFYMNYQLC